MAKKGPRVSLGPNVPQKPRYGCDRAVGWRWSATRLGRRRLGLLPHDQIIVLRLRPDAEKARREVLLLIVQAAGPLPSGIDY
jgi:hypothetical protein